MRRLRIAQVVATFPPYMGGTGNVCYHNALELAKLGHQVKVFTSRFPDIDYAAYPPEMEVRRLKPLLRFRNTPLIPQLLNLEPVDIIHVHCPFISGAELVFLCSKLKRIPFVVTYQQDLIFSGPMGYFAKAYNKAFRSIILSNARKIVVPTIDYVQHSSMSPILQRRGKDIIELTNGVDIDKFSPIVSGNEVRSAHRIKHGMTIVLFVGALDESHAFKGVDVLLKAFSKLGRAEDVVLLIVGEGGLKRSYQMLAQQLDISQNVIFAGGVPDDRLANYYAACDFLVLPSVSRAEMFGLVLVEAMATGKPVIASNLPGVRKVVAHERDGLLVEPGDTNDLVSKMRYLLDNAPIRERFGREGRRKAVEKYSWKAIGEKLEAIYLEVLA